MFTSLATRFYEARKFFWNYPDHLFFGRKSLAKSVKKFYKLNIPFSHFISISMILLLIVAYFSSNQSLVLSLASSTLIEGEIMGADENGNAVKLNRINPLINSNIQLEKDINELVYEPLIKVDTKGQPRSVLAEYVILEAGSRYQFKLKSNLKWHDGQPVTVADVVKTFDLIKTLDGNPETSNIYSRAANKIDLLRSITDDNVFEFKVKTGQIIPGFFEAISFKIMPAHLLKDVNVSSILQPDPIINRQPVGTGPYMFSKAEDDNIDLAVNENYWGPKPKIGKIRFKLFATEKTAVEALQTGQIHGLTSFFNDSAVAFKDNANIALLKSNYIYNQYWGIYFNLGDTGPTAFKDVKVRQAINSAINKPAIIQALDGFAEVADGPIPKSSFAYNPQIKFPYNIAAANALLTEAGYVPGADGIRAKGNDRLSFTLTLINSKDRETIAQVIQANLKLVGIEVKTNPVDLSTAVDEHILPRMYDLLLYGVQTLIDPDRYELFDSNQIEPPGLNLASYVSADKTSKVVDGKIAKIPSVDDDLDTGRRLIDEKSRIKEYDHFQKIIATEVPVVFLFHPEELYALNRRVKGVQLNDINSIEERFNSIANWEITSGKF